MRYTTRIIVPPRVRRSGAPGTPGGSYAPQVLGVRKSFGFGDWLGVATAGHLAAAAAHPDFAPLLAQQSSLEKDLTGRSPKEVIAAVTRATSAVRYRQPWGADADRLKTPQDVEDAALAGFTYFTIDPSEFIHPGADRLSADALPEALEAVISAGEFPADWTGPYLDRTIDLPGNHVLRLTLEPLQRAVVKYARAINHCARMAESIARANQGRPYEIEAAFDDADLPTTPLEHLFIGLELEARGVRLTSLALRLPGEFEKGVDYRGDLESFETRLREHAAVAQFCGPYKLSIHHGSDKFAVYPIIGRTWGDALHIKTAGTSYLEALRVVLRVDPALFSEIAQYCVGHFDEDAAGIRISTTSQEVNALARLAAGDEEQVYLEGRAGRQLLHLTFGSVLRTGTTAQGRPFKDAILELLENQVDLYQEILVRHFDKHFSLLNAG